VRHPDPKTSGYSQPSPSKKGRPTIHKIVALLWVAGVASRALGRGRLSVQTLRRMFLLRDEIRKQQFFAAAEKIGVV
jgi:hypothetical protein